MSINKRSSSSQSRLNTKFKRIQKPENKKSTRSIIKIIIYSILFFIIFCFLFLIIYYNKFLRNESIEELKNYKVNETSILYDKKGRELYRFFLEDRTYVEFDKISKNMINAIVAGEDKKFWENPGFDIIGLIRAGITSFRGGSRIRGTSTLTQQLIRNTIIKKKAKETMKEGIDRKVSEIFLSYNLTKSISKEKILELYLNKIEFGHNSFGIESASNRFFNKSSKDLDVFESSVIASLPKGPTYYSPYNHPERLIGYINFVGENTKKLITKEEVETEKEIVESLKSKILKFKGSAPSDGGNKYIICSVEKNLVKKFRIDSEGCVVLDYDKLNSFISDIVVKSGEKTISYEVGRNAYILQRMLEDKYITFEDYKKAIVKGIGYTFNKKKENIIAPHFVFYVKEHLEKKYGQEAISTGGLKIYTTIDLDVQKKAEEMVKAQAAKNKSNFDAKNAALISIDNKTGGIIAMVGNENYYSDDGKGNVNVVTSKLQPGSAFKPFVYSLAMYQNQLGTKTPVFDVKTDFGNWSPKNFDGKFMGKMNISTALNYSRNIPAVKMFFMTNGIKGLREFMHKLGATSFNPPDNYGSGVALGTGEMTLLDLAKAYTVFANMGEKVEINPIFKIVDNKGNVIEELKNPKKEKVMTAGQAYLINHILSDNSTRPSGWNKFLTIGRPAAVKTGTSTKEVKGKNVNPPANLLTIGYTPQVTTVVWSGNISGKETNMKGSGLEASAPLWKKFMEYYHSDEKVEKWEKPSDVKKVTISDISGLLPNPEGFHNFLVESYFINPPKEIDKSYRVYQYDALCNGKITEQTPEDARKRTVRLVFKSLKPENPAWEKPVQAWANSGGAASYGASGGYVSVKDEVCSRSESGGNIVIKSNLGGKNYNIGANPIDIAFKSDKPIIKIEIILNGELSQSIKVENKTVDGIRQNIFIPEKFSNKKVKVEIKAINDEYFSNTEVKEINVGNVKEENTNSSGNTETPKTEEPKKVEETKKEEETKKSIDINVTNPKNSSIRINKEDYFNLRFNISEKESLSNVNVLINNVVIEKLGNSGSYVLPINQTNKMEEGKHSLKIQAIDVKGQVKEKSIQIEILQ